MAAIVPKARLRHDAAMTWRNGVIEARRLTCRAEFLNVTPAQAGVYERCGPDNVNDFVDA